MDSIYKITLILDLSATPGRNLMRGIACYSRHFGPWQLNNIGMDFYKSASKNSNFLATLKKNLINSDGVIMREPAAWDYLEKINVPVIVASAISDVEVPTKPTIMTDSKAIGTMGAEFFIHKGFRQLAFCGLKKMLWSEHREQYFIEAAEKTGVKVFKYSFSYPGNERNRDTVLNKLAKWIQELPKPIGIMAANDICGKLVVDSCRKRSIKVPQEVAVLGVDNDDIFCELTYPSLSSIGLNTEKAGYDSAALLHRIIKGVKVDTHKIMIEPVGVEERQSTDVIAVDDELVSAVMRYIQNNASRPLQVQDIVDEFNISRRCLYSKFSKISAGSVYGQIRRIRVEKISKMLTETNLSIKEIAFSFGFSDVDHISRLFRKEKGMTPTQYRAKYL